MAGWLPLMSEGARAQGSGLASGSDQDFELLRDQVSAQMAQAQVPGVGLGLYYAGQQWMTGLGVTNIDYPLAVDENTLFPIGSVSKTFTGTAMLILSGQGLVDLDSPVRRYLPSFGVADESVSASVTVRDTLRHTAGWFGDVYGYADGDDSDALAKFVDEMAPLQQILPLGSFYSYNNAAFNVAGRVIEVVTGKSFEQAIHDLIFQPLGMSRSTFFAADAISYATVSGHDVVGGKLSVVRDPWNQIPRASHAAGGIITNVNDLLQYARFQLGDGSAPDGAPLVPPAGMAQLRMPQTGPGSAGLYQADGIGISWLLLNIDGTRILAHDGGISQRFKSRLWLIPERQFALTMLTNHGNGDAIFAPVTAWALEHYLGLRNQAPIPNDLLASRLEEYIGRYAVDLAKVPETQYLIALTLDEPPDEEDLQEIHVISLVDGALQWRDVPPGESFTLKFYAPDRAVIVDGPSAGERIDFLRDASGAVGWIRRGVRAVPKVS